jgi:hypothetical protein
MEGGPANSDIDLRIKPLDGAASDDLNMQVDPKYLAG